MVEHASASGAPVVLASEVPPVAPAVDEHNPFWPKYREIAERVAAQAKEPFEIADGAAPCAAETMAMAVRYAVRLAFKEADVGAARRQALLERVVPRVLGDDAAAGRAGGQAPLDALLRSAALRALAESGVEERWREAAAYQEAWERTETRPGPLPRTARWLAGLWPIAAGIAAGAIIGMGSAFTYYYIIAPVTRAVR